MNKLTTIASLPGTGSGCMSALPAEVGESVSLGSIAEIQVSVDFCMPTDEQMRQTAKEQAAKRLEEHAAEARERGVFFSTTLVVDGNDGRRLKYDAWKMARDHKVAAMLAWAKESA